MQIQFGGMGMNLYKGMCMYHKMYTQIICGWRKEHGYSNEQKALCFSFENPYFFSGIGIVVAEDLFSGASVWYR